MIHLVGADVELLDAALSGDDALTTALDHDVAPGWATFRGALRPTRDALASKPADFAWGTRLFVTDDPPELVGWGGFKGAPADGVVEVGYEIAETHWGRGYATAVTELMVAEAFAAADVTAVIAHTLPETNASNRVLVKVGFAFDQPVQEGANTVWRFSLPRSQTPQDG